MSTTRECLKKFDKLCLNRDEQQQIDKLKEAEHQAVRTRSSHLARFTFDSVRAVGFGSPMGAIKSVRDACKYNQANKQVTEIKEQQSVLRQRAKERYERTVGVSVDKMLGWKGEDLCYG